jgi:hypothetical protein
VAAADGFENRGMWKDQEKRVCDGVDVKDNSGTVLREGNTNEKIHICEGYGWK